MKALITQFIAWLREILFLLSLTFRLRLIDYKLGDDHNRAGHGYLRRIDHLLAHQREFDKRDLTIDERIEFGNEIVAETERISALAKAHFSLSEYYYRRAHARIGYCDECSHYGRRIIKPDHDGGATWVCPNRIECHARRPG